jgi:spore coat protein A, manganese oxidase
MYPVRTADHGGGLMDLDRRRFLMIMGGGASATLGGGSLLMPTTAAGARGTLTPFVDPLPIPETIEPSASHDGVPRYHVAMRAFKKRLHRDLPPTPLWGYNGLYPGPTFEARRDMPIAVRWANDLPAQHMFPIDQTLHGDEPGQPAVRTVVHLHGARVLPENDGYPEAWFTKEFSQTGPAFAHKTYDYPNDQPATTLWYHDHALGTTRLNVYAGLAGFYLLRDVVEDDLNLPKGEFEIPLLLQDRSFNADGSLLYPVVDTGGDSDPRVPPVWIPEFFGDTVLVNGKVWPHLEVEPRKYRFRILNGSNARFYHLTLIESTPDGRPLGRPGPIFNQIASDGGFLPAPVPQADLTIAPAERFDVIVDFSGAYGKSFLLSNDAKAPFPDGDDIIPANVMLFRVTRRLRGRDGSSVPRQLVPVVPLNPQSAVKTRDLVLSELDSADPFGNPIMGLINAQWDSPVIEDPKAGSVEIWRLINTTEDAHPIHIHLVQFQILDRQPFDTSQYPDRLIFTGPSVRPPGNEQPAFKDTVKAFPGQVTRLIARFDLPAGTPVQRGDRFRYVFHCHILEHEDNEMMRPYDVVS